MLALQDGFAHKGRWKGVLGILIWSSIRVTLIYGCGRIERIYIIIITDVITLAMHVFRAVADGDWTPGEAFNRTIRRLVGNIVVIFAAKDYRSISTK
jgi:hypothetical protein